MADKTLARNPSLDAPENSTLRHARAHWIRSFGRWWLDSPELLSRGLDLLLTSVLILLLSPLLGLRAVLARLRTGRCFDRQTRIGRDGKTVTLHRFAGSGVGADLARLLDVLRGDLSLTGPRAVRAQNAAEPDRWDTTRLQARPGLVSPFELHRRLGIAYQSERHSQRQYVLKQKPGTDLSLLLRAVPSLLLHGRRSNKRLLRFLGVAVDNLQPQEVIARVAADAHIRRSLRISFVNPDCLNTACNDWSYRQALADSHLVLGDGIGLQIAGRILGQKPKANLNGTDLFPLICGRAEQLGQSVFFLGARPGVADQVAEQMTRRFPRLQVAGTGHGYFSPEDEPALIQKLRRSGAQILFVAMGAPKQELWLSRRHVELGIPVPIGVGGLFDFYSGRIARAPAAWRELGLEWLWRLRCEPARLARRYLLGNPLFLFRTACQRLGYCYHSALPVEKGAKSCPRSTPQQPHAAQANGFVASVAASVA